MNRRYEKGTVPSERQRDSFLQFWKNAPRIEGWSLLAHPAERVHPIDERLPADDELGLREWKVEVVAVDVDNPDVAITVDLRLRDGRLHLRELRFFVTGVGGEYDGTDLFRRLRLGALHTGLKRYVRDMPLPVGVSESEWQLEFPQPGRAGRPDRYYAEWVAKYLDAIDRFGARRYMPGLLEENPGYTAKNVRRIIERAEQLGLITARPGPGRAGGRMTAKCKRLLKGQ